MSDGVTHFVWFYIHGPSGGWELKHSILSVERWFRGTFRITVIGDRPDWYAGHMIEVPRVSRSDGGGITRQPYADTKAKFRIAATHDSVSDELVWMMDDQFFLREVTIEDLRVSRADLKYRRPENTQSARFWNQCVSRSFGVLQMMGFNPKQYATHLPHVFDKQTLRTVMKLIDPLRDQVMMLPEIFYGAMFRSEPEHCHPFLCRLQRPVSKRLFDREVARSTVLNLHPHAFRNDIKPLIEGALK